MGGKCCRKDKEKQKELDAEDGFNPERGQWDSPVEFILSCLGYAVGLGNIWRFPYMCYENGGGAFLIPYVIMLTFVGLPVFFIELSTGQYSGAGPLHVWEAAPLFQGIGMGMVVISFLGCIYYNMVIGWSLYYLFACFQKNLPWKDCTNDFNTPYCYSKREADDCEALPNATWFNQTCYNETWKDLADPDVLAWLKNVSHADNRVSASEEYLNYEVLDRSDKIEDTEYVKWDLALCLLAAWVLCFVCVIKGIKSSGKAVYFTATFPYLVLAILFFRGVTLEGAGKGIEFYIIPEWDKLAKPKVWADAAGQIFFSLSVGMGGLMTFASYNKFHNNVYRDTLIVVIGNSLTSFFAGFVIFSVLGFMAHELGVDVKDVANSGSGLAFVAYPEVVTRLTPSHLWAILFFLMLITLGLDSQFAGIENLMTATVDTFPRLRPKKTLVALILCIIMFILGLTMCTRAGLYWTDLIGYYSSGWCLVLIGLAEGIVFPWIYGTKRLMADIEHMVGFKLNIHWWICWTFITPVLLIIVLGFNIYEFTPLAFGDYTLPDWAQALGWMMAVAAVIPIPIFAAGRIIQSYKKPAFDGLNVWQRVVKLCKPSDKWMPSFEKYRKDDVLDDQHPPAYTVGNNNSYGGELRPTTFDNAAYQNSETSTPSSTRL